jgi:hypothetical protein
MFSPEQSNRPRESSKDRAKGVIREFDRSTSRSPGRSSGIRDSHRAESGHLGKSGARQLSSNNLSAKSGKESDKKKVKSSKRSQDNTESLIDIDFEEEDEIDPNVIEIAANTDTQETKVLHKVEPAFEVRDVLKALKGLILTKKPQESAQTPAAPAPRTEPAFETRDVLKAFSGLLQAKAPQVQKVDIVKIPAPKTEPAFETRDVLRALSGLIKPKATSHAPTEAQQAPPKIEPAFETRDVLRALSGLLKPKAPVQAQTDPSPAPPKIEPAFETRDVLKALGSLLKPKTVNHQNESEAVQSAPKIEPAFETRDVLRALSSLLKPKGPVPQSSTEPVHQAPKTEPAFETREVLKALHSLLKPKIPTDTAGLLPPGAQSFPVVIQRVNIAKVETSQP